MMNIIRLITRNQIRDETSYTNLTEHYATARDTKTPSSNASNALSPNKSQPGKCLLTCNINTERKDLNDFSSSPMKGNSITCLCISFVYCEDESQSNSYVSYWIRCKPLLIIKVSFIFPFRTLHVCIIEETWTVWERILTRVCRNTQFYSFDVSSHFWTLYG